MEMAYSNDGLYEFISLFWSIICLSGWSVFRICLMEIQFIILVIIGLLAAFYTFCQLKKQFNSSDKSEKCSKCPAVNQNEKNGYN
jgi:hypothetical protein